MISNHKAAFELAPLDDGLRLSILTMASHDLSLAQGKQPVEYRSILSRALPILQRSVYNKKVDEFLLMAVACLGLIEISTGNYRAAHGHFKGVGAMLRYFNKNDHKLNPLASYVIQCSWKCDTVLALYGYGFAISDDQVSIDVQWIELIDDLVTGWVCLEICFIKFMRRTARYKNWAENLRRQHPECVIKQLIVDLGNKLSGDIISWATVTVPPLEFCPENVAFGVGSAFQFLGYPQVRFKNAYHAEIHLLWYTNLLIISYIKHIQPGPVDSERVALAIRFCQYMAALDEYSGTRCLKVLTFGMFYATLTFENPYCAGKNPINGSE